MPIRKNLAVSDDPYIDLRGQKEIAVCGKCGAVYHHKRWALEIPAEKISRRKVRKVLCPACRKIQDRFPGGVVTLKGAVLGRKREEILRRVRNAEARARRVNPLERIISIKGNRKTTEILTTNERFAQRIGREIKRAFKGRVAYHWSKNNKFLRVDWEGGEEKDRK
jgi:NMD protein affecting ribosome stability and mRNA decay